MTIEPARRPRRSSLVPVPGALFSASRNPPFALLDDRGHEVLLSERAGEAPDPQFYVSPGDLSGLQLYLSHHLHTIVISETIDVEDRAWALHHLLMYETANIFRHTLERVPLQPLLALTRELARFQVEHRESRSFLDLVFRTNFCPVSHAVETALCATALAAADGALNTDQIAALSLGGLFADIGKLTLPAEMLVRDARLSDQEWHQMREHPQRSAQILRGATGVIPARAMLAVLSHHERWDGTGYPAAISGKLIKYEGRVVAIADAFGTIAADGAYRLEPVEALGEMARAQGHFDPDLLRSFVLLLGSSGAGAPQLEVRAE